MSTLTTTTTIQGRVNGRSINIQLVGTVSNVVYYLDRAGKLNEGMAMQSLNESTPLPPTVTNADIVYMRADSYAGPSQGTVDFILITTGSASSGLIRLDPGQWVEFGRAEAGGVFADGVSATASTLENVLSLEQVQSNAMPVTTGLLVVFKPLS
jgi:hypothetical protein